MSDKNDIDIFDKILILNLFDISEDEIKNNKQNNNLIVDKE